MRTLEIASRKLGALFPTGKGSDGGGRSRPKEEVGKGMEKWVSVFGMPEK